MYVFDWDENKNRINQKKHGIDFEEASSVFFAIATGNLIR